MAFCFLNINKPKGITSFDVIHKLRKRFGIKKIGHSGTLDPMAEGVMIVAVGAASRLLEYLNSDKKYVAVVRFGYSSTTLDAEGIIAKENSPKFTEAELKKALTSFVGEIEQIPPKYSAIKMNGKKLCDIMRKNPNAQITPPSRKVKIYDIDLLDFSEDYTAKVHVSCSSGTYIRTLLDDVAKSLDTRGYLTMLERTSIGKFEIKDAIEIDEANISKNGINPTDALEIDKYFLDEKEFLYAKNGASFFPKADFNFPSDKPIALIFDKKLVSIGILFDNKIVIKKFFNV